jgi:hypothetical protein
MSSDGAIYGGGSLALISIIGIIYTKLNHKRIRANCCGKKIEMELDIDSIRSVKNTKVQPEESPQELPVHAHKIDKGGINK